MNAYELLIDHYRWTTWLVICMADVPLAPKHPPLARGPACGGGDTREAAVT